MIKTDDIECIAMWIIIIITLVALLIISNLNVKAWTNQLALNDEIITKSNDNFNIQSDNWENQKEINQNIVDALTNYENKLNEVIDKVNTHSNQLQECTCWHD